MDCLFFAIDVYTQVKGKSAEITISFEIRRPSTASISADATATHCHYFPGKRGTTLVKPKIKLKINSN